MRKKRRIDDYFSLSPFFLFRFPKNKTNRRASSSSLLHLQSTHSQVISNTLAERLQPIIIECNSEVAIDNEQSNGKRSLISCFEDQILR